MSEPADKPDGEMPTIDRYLAGELGRDEASRFASRLELDPALRADVERHKAIKVSLVRSVPVPRHGLAAAQLAQAVARLEGGAVRERMSFARRVAYSGLAAGLMLTAGLVIVLVGKSVPSGQPIAGGSQGGAQLALAMAEGFKPTYAESDPAAIEAIIVEKLGVRLVLPRGEAFTYLGLRTNVGESPAGLALVADVRGQRVLLLVDRSNVHGGLGLPTPKGLYRHARTLRSLGLVELSGSEKPVFDGVEER